MSRRPLEMVVAADDDGGIARDGDLPWHLPGDLRHFAELTRGPEGEKNAVIMGRVTWESIPDRFRPLPGRLNIVLSRRADLPLPEGVLLAANLDAAVAQVGPDIARIFVVGGSQIYALALERPDCRHIFLTRVHGRFDCDVFFPAFEDRFERAEVLSRGSEGGIDYEIERWERRGPWAPEPSGI